MIPLFQFSVYRWFPRLLRYLPFVRHCIVLAYPRACLPLASPLGSCNSAFYQKLIHFHRHQIEFLCIQYLTQKEEDFRGTYTLQPFVTCKALTSNMRGWHYQRKTLAGLETFSLVMKIPGQKQPDAPTLSLRGDFFLVPLLRVSSWWFSSYHILAYPYLHFDRTYYVIN